MTNRALDRDEIPYGQIFDGNSPPWPFSARWGSSVPRAFCTGPNSNEYIHFIERGFCLWLN